MLNGRNWWTNHDVKFEHQEDLNQRIEYAAKSVWNDVFAASMNVSYEVFLTSVKKVMNIVNSPRQESKAP